jgi:hypothetical protein
VSRACFLLPLNVRNGRKRTLTPARRHTLSSGQIYQIGYLLLQCRNLYGFLSRLAAERRVGMNGGRESRCGPVANVARRSRRLRHCAPQLEGAPPRRGANFVNFRPPSRLQPAGRHWGRPSAAASRKRRKASRPYRVIFVIFRHAGFRACPPTPQAPLIPASAHFVGAGAAVRADSPAQGRPCSP